MTRADCFVHVQGSSGITHTGLLTFISTPTAQDYQRSFGFAAVTLQRLTEWHYRQPYPVPFMGGAVVRWS
jgi:hypothetical protein